MAGRPLGWNGPVSIAQTVGVPHPHSSQPGTGFDGAPVRFLWPFGAILFPGVGLGDPSRSVDRRVALMLYGLLGEIRFSRKTGLSRRLPAFPGMQSTESSRRCLPVGFPDGALLDKLWERLLWRFRMRTERRQHSSVLRDL